MDIEITKQDGHKFTLSELGLYVTNSVISSIQMDEQYQTIEGRTGLVDHGAEYRSRMIKVSFVAKPYDGHNFAHLRDKIFEHLTDTKPFYIREMAKVNIDGYDFVDMHEKAKDFDDKSKYVNGRRYLVRLVNTIEPDNGYDNFKGELEFRTVRLPFAETVYTTTELHDSGFSSTANKYGLVDNIDTRKVKYRFTENEFTVYNAGNVDVEPESMELMIQANYLTTSGNFTIRNKTTGEEIVLKRESNRSHFRIDGMKTLLGLINVFRDTNKRFIRLVPGGNHFEILNGTFDEIWFRYRFYYK